MSEQKEHDELAEEIQGLPYDEIGKNEQVEVDMEIAVPGSILPRRAQPTV